MLRVLRYSLMYAGLTKFHVYPMTKNETEKLLCELKSELQKCINQIYFALHVLQNVNYYVLLCLP